MKMSRWVIFATLLLVFSASGVGAQDGPPAPPIETPATRAVGQAKVYHFARQNRTQVILNVHLLGVAADIPAKKDVLVMNVTFNTPGGKVLEPKSVELTINSFSVALKYHEDHKFTFSADGKKLVAVGPSLWTAYFNSSTIASESYKIKEMPYADLRKLAYANEATIQLGKTKIRLTPSMIQALKDLDNTIER